MKKPLIGVNLDVWVQDPVYVRVARRYTESIQKAGGIPVLLPPMGKKDVEAVLDTLDGLMLIGGLDYSPSLYNEEPSPKLKPVHPDREKFDVLLIKRALKRKKLPILAICGGHQLLIIATGGALVQDIESAMPGRGAGHGSPTVDKPHHAVLLERGCQLSSIYRRVRIDSVLSSHHQACRRVGKDLAIVGSAPDGVIEAVEHRTRPFTIGVQWHPEADFKGHGRLFRAFVKKCAGKAGRGRK